METLLVRLKAYDPRRGFVLKRYTYGGIRFQVERGWSRVSEQVGEYLRGVRQAPRNPHAPLAFDVCTDDEARALEDREAKEASTRQNATEDLKLSPARGERGALTTADLRPPQGVAAPDVAAGAASSAANAGDPKARKDKGG